MIQLQFLNYLLSTRDPTLITLNNLTDDFFSDYKGEFNYIKNHLLKYGNVPDKETFLSVFKDFDVVDVHESDKYLIDALYEDRNKRILIETFNNIRGDIIGGNTDKAIQVFTSSFDRLLKAKHIDAVDIYSDLSRYDTYIAKSTDFSKFYVRTGFDELDKVIGGWDRKEELATIVARPNIGKSFILFKTAIAAAMQGLKVGIYSGEMSEDKVGYRTDTLISHISNTKIIHGSDSIQVDYRKFLDNIREKLQGKILVLTPSMVNGPVGVSTLRSFIDKYELDMLCIDQHSLLEDDRGARNDTERAANISRDLKLLQVMKKIPIIAVSQQNRESTEEAGVSTKNIARSDRIGQDSTVVIFIERKDDIMSLILTKSRDSINGARLSYKVNLDTGTFTYIPDEEDANGGSDCEQVRDEYEYNVDTSANIYGGDDSPF